KRAENKRVVQRQPWLEFAEFLEIQKSTWSKRARFEINHQVGCARERDQVRVRREGIQSGIQRIRSYHFEVQTNSTLDETQRHKGTKKRRDQRSFNAAFLCAFVPLCFMNVVRIRKSGCSPCSGIGCRQGLRVRLQPHPGVRDSTRRR